jgi:hypothetical protein
MSEINSILNELESLTILFKELSEVDRDKFQIPMDCFKKVVNNKLKIIKQLTKEI